MRHLLTALVAVFLLGLSATAHANTTADALARPYDYESLFRTRTAPSPDIWKRPIPAAQPLDQDSALYAQGLAGQMGINPDGSWKNPPSGQPLGLRWRSSYNVYVTTAGTPYKSACSRFVINGNSWSWNQSFHNATVTNKVPVPTGALQYDGGSDHSMAIYDTPSNTYYEFYQGLDPAPAGTKDPQGRACDYLYAGGGRIRQVGTLPGQPWYVGSPGYFRNNQPAEDMVWGRQATGAMPVIAGLITPQQWNSPSSTDGFGHVVSVQVPWARCGVRHWPAVRNDCGAGGAMPEGALFRFPGGTTCERWDAEIASPVIAPARRLYLERLRGFCANGRKYGFRVTDQTGNGFAFDMVNKPGLLPDGGSAGGGQHWPNEYLDVFRLDWPRVEVLAESPHPAQWVPGCLC